MTEWMAWTKNCFAPGCEHSLNETMHRHAKSGDLQVYGEGGTRQSQGWTNNCGRPGCGVSAAGEWHRHLDGGSTVTAGADASQDVTAQRITSDHLVERHAGLITGVIHADPSKNETLWVNGVARSKWCKRCGQARSYPDSPFCRFHDPEIELAPLPPDSRKMRGWAEEVIGTLVNAWKEDDEKIIPWNDYRVIVHIGDHLRDTMWWQQEQSSWRMIMGDKEYFCKTDVPAYWMTYAWSMAMNSLVLDRRKRNISIPDMYARYVGSCSRDDHASRLIERLRMVLTR